MRLAGHGLTIYRPRPANGPHKGYKRHTTRQEGAASMSEFLDRMKTAAKADRKKIVLPEGEDPRTIAAARQIVDEGIADLVILGDPAKIDVPGVTVIDRRLRRAAQEEGRHAARGHGADERRHLLWHHDGQDGRR